MEKRYQVFISSTFQDLQEERKEVMQALLKLNCMPAGMELFPAANEEQLKMIKKVIDECDYYVLIIAGRYGSIDEKTGKSYTQLEYEYALEIEKPIIAFVHKDPGRIPIQYCENNEEKRKKLEEFKEIVQNKLVNYWVDSKELNNAVILSMINLIRDYPAIGWVKATNIFDDEKMQDMIRIQKENSELQKENLELKQKLSERKDGTKESERYKKWKIEFDIKINEIFPEETMTREQKIILENSILELKDYINNSSNFDSMVLDKIENLLINGLKTYDNLTREYIKFLKQLSWVDLSVLLQSENVHEDLSISHSSLQDKIFFVAVNLKNQKLIDYPFEIIKKSVEYLMKLRIFDEDLYSKDGLIYVKTNLSENLVKLIKKEF